MIMKKKVVVAGHICLDITPVFDSKKVEKLTDIMTPGKLLQVGMADVHTGGAVANTGLAMKLLGADVLLMGKVGADVFGDMVLSILEKYDASQGMIVSEKESTSYSVVLAIPGIDRIFLHNSGANNTFCTDDIPVETLKEAVLFHFGYPSLMSSMYQNQGAELVKMMKYMKTKGIATSLDMAVVDADSEAGKVEWNYILQKVLPYVDFFVPSVEELCYMLDRERFYEWQERAAGRDITELLDIDMDIKPLADKCISYGAKVVLLKCGVPGMYLQTVDKKTMQGIGKRLELNLEDWAEKKIFERSYIPEQVLSGTGAGDTSIAAFLTAMLEGYPVKCVMQLAAATGASCVAAYDAISGLKSLTELKEKIDAGWNKVEV